MKKLIIILSLMFLLTVCRSTLGNDEKEHKNVSSETPTGEDKYVFYYSGGMSWAVPYTAGLYALCCHK